MISALRQQGGPSHLWNGARRSSLSEPGRHETWSRCSKSGQIPVGSTVVRPNGSVVDLKARTLCSF